jgi:hypothetical protein
MSVAVTANSHSQRRSTATSALPSMTRCSSSSDIVTRSSRASIKQPYMLDVEDDMAVAPPVQNVTLYECPFRFLRCWECFYNPEEWRTHAETHFGGNPPPRHAICCFCDMVFNDPNPYICWGLRMHHVAGHHIRGDRLHRCRPDHALMRYLYELGLMQQRELQAHSVDERSSVYGEDELEYVNQPVQPVIRRTDYVVQVNRRGQRRP